MQKTEQRGPYDRLEGSSKHLSTSGRSRGRRDMRAPRDYEDRQIDMTLKN